jgi:hypothetical protein
VFLFTSVVAAQAQEAEPATAASVPAATRSQAECAGFISDTPIPHDLFVIGGGDDDFRSVVRQFTEGESVFLSQTKPGEIAVGTEYRVIRPAHEIFSTTRYTGQHSDLSKLGTPYEDVAVVKVSHVNPEGVVASVTFSCAPIFPGDTLVSFQPRTIPEYTVSPPLDHFAPLDKNKTGGRIVGTRNNFGFLGDQSIIYMSLGGKDGTAVGRRFRIYKRTSSGTSGVSANQPTPPETIGEAVVLSVQSRSSVAIVVSSYREISAGDYVEAE